jgi:hypothetical protein
MTAMAPPITAGGGRDGPGARGSTRRRALGTFGAVALLGTRARTALPASAAGADGTAVYFPETGHHLQLGFLEHWRRHQGPARLGFPVTDEQWDAGIGGAGGAVVQYFQLGRLEWRAGPQGGQGEVREVLEPFDTARAGSARGLSPAAMAAATAAVPRIQGTPDWTAALAPPPPALTATPDPVRAGRTFVVTLSSDDPAGPLAVDGAVAPVGGETEETPLRLIPAGGGRYLGVAAPGMEEEPRPWAVMAVVRNALGLESPPQTVPLRVADGAFPFQRLAIPYDLVPLVDPQVRLRENLTLAAVMARGESEPLWRGRFLQPVAGSLVTVHGARRTYVDPAGRAVGAAQHPGVDLGTPLGTPILAAAAGVVAFAGTWSIKGNVVVVDHGAGVHSVHGHASSFAVSPGQRVAPGQVLAYVGTTGLSTGPHLHWEVRVGGVAVDPLEWTQRSDLVLA